MPCSCGFCVFSGRSAECQAKKASPSCSVSSSLASVTGALLSPSTLSPPWITSIVIYTLSLSSPMCTTEALFSIFESIGPTSIPSPSSSRNSSRCSKSLTPCTSMCCYMIPPSGIPTNIVMIVATQNVECEASPSDSSTTCRTDPFRNRPVPSIAAESRVEEGMKVMGDIQARDPA